MKRVIVWLVAAAAMVVWAGGEAYAQDPKLVASGKKIYADKECDECHRIAGKGKNISVLDGIGGKMSEADIRKWMTDTVEMEKTLKKKPKVKMSSKKVPLTAADIDALTAYMLSLK